MTLSDTFPIPLAIAQHAHITERQYREQYAASIRDPEAFWASQAESLTWRRRWSKVRACDYSRGEIQWFTGAQLNVSENCLDRHLATRAEKRAIIWEGDEPGETRSLTYRELHESVCRIANVLKSHGVTRGDRVAIYMPMVPETAAAMLACARIGAVHSVIFAGFSAHSVRDRINDCKCKVVLTANEGRRAGKAIALKAIVDEAVAECPSVERVFVFKRTDTPVPMKAGRDLWLHELTANASSECPPEAMDSEDPLFVLYTSGSTGKPKGLQHTQGGYLLYAALTHRLVFDLREDDVYFCAADVGWITGHSYIVYGPLANGATTVLFESTPLYPHPGRYWQTIERHKVTIFYTAPTAIRAVAKESLDFVRKYDLKTLRILGSVGEPINRDAWLWYHEYIGKKRCAIVDTWWQTETGGIMISPLPGAIATKPGSATLPFLGIEPCLVDEKGNEIQSIEAEGRLCIKSSWPGQARTVYGDHSRFVATYFSQFPGKYFTGDGCRRDADGYYWITGRVDDVLNVSGHRLGTAEIESAIVASGIVAEAAVVGMPHEIKGTGIYAFCILKAEQHNSVDDARSLVKSSVRKEIGSLAQPDFIQFVPGLPKTRSGKIMRRILRKIVEGRTEDLGDISTLADPAVVQHIIAGALIPS